MSLEGIVKGFNVEGRLKKRRRQGRRRRRRDTEDEEKEEEEGRQKGRLH